MDYIENEWINIFDNHMMDRENGMKIIFYIMNYEMNIDY